MHPQAYRKRPALFGRQHKTYQDQTCGIENAIQSLRSRFEKSENEGVLLIDAKNAFKYLNRNFAVEKIEEIVRP